MRYLMLVINMKITKYNAYKYNSLYEQSIKEYFSKDIYEHAYIIAYQTGEYIQRQASTMDYLYFVVEGKAKVVYIEENGKQSILQFIKEKDFIGDLSFVGSEQTTKEVVAISDTKCFAVSIAYAKEVLYNDVLFLQKMGKYIGDKVLRRVDHYSKTQAYELKYRFAELLLETSTNDEYREKQVEIADYLGVSYRHMLYTIKSFKDLGYLEKRKGYYIIHRKQIEMMLLEKNK